MYGVRRWIRWLPVALGVILLGIASAGLYVSSEISRLVIDTPGSGMVATGLGDGGSSATDVLVSTHAADGIATSGVVPTTPILYLQPAVEIDYSKTGPAGRIPQAQPAYWKVWWDGGTQAEDVVSLQDHLNFSDAENGLSSEYIYQVGGTYVTTTGVHFTVLSSFTTPGIPGSSGYVARGVSDHVPFEMRYVVFGRESTDALVSTISYRGTVNAASFGAFALAEYGRMRPTGVAPLVIVAFAVGPLLVVLGIAVLIWTGRTTRAASAAGRFANLPPPPTAPAAGWYPDPASPTTRIRWWDGNRWSETTTGKPRQPQTPSR